MLPPVENPHLQKKITMTKYFGTNGARGTIDEFPPALAKKLASATGKYLNCGRVLVARDGRLTGKIYRDAIVEGLLAAGCRVTDLGMVSSPTAEFMIKKLGASGLIIITASHNPPEYNGMKVVDKDGLAVSRERAEEIEKMAEGGMKGKKRGVVEKYENAIEEHISAIIGRVDVERIRTRKPRLVLDCGNGMASVIAPQLFSRMGCEVVPINSHVDGNFPGRPSEPTEENVKDLMKIVKELRADAGIAWDGDADRVAFVDERGRYVIGDKVFALSVLLKLREKKGNVITTVATSLAVEDIAKKYGCEVAYTKIGAPYLCEEIVKGGVIAGEEVGGVIWPEISLAKEGIYTATKTVEAICDKPLSQWIAELPDYRNIKEKIMTDEYRKKVLVEKMRRYAAENGLNYIEKDGVRINYENGWVIVRPSGTENYVRIFAEAKTAKEAKELINKHRKIIGE